MARFQRVDRILRTQDFKRLMKSGKRRTSESFVVVVRSRTDANKRSTDEKRTRLGVTVSRQVGKSVVRNRIKRCIREWFHDARARLPDGSDIVVIARRTARDLSGSEVVAVLDRVIDGPRGWGDRSNDG